MGQDIETDRVESGDEADFRNRLREETKILKRWFDERAFDYADDFTVGLEVEAWLTDRDWRPAAKNDEFLAAVDDPLVVPELSKFNFEINADPHILTGDALSRIEAELNGLWAKCAKDAGSLDLNPLMIGILPTVRDEMLQPDTMSDSNRYRLLNTQVMRARGSRPLHIKIDGHEQLDYRCGHIMLEAACTSLQAHLKVNQENAVRLYNASTLAAAPMVAATANSPFLYGKSLWAETRIPAFEQATSMLGLTDLQGRQLNRVTLGSGYLRHSFLEPWLENLSYPAILPILHDGSDRLPHLRLQNGTIWRWNRPILGFDGEGRPHLRIEHRVMPAGPTIADTVANLALYFGTALALGRAENPPELDTSFEEARANFYACARDGINATVRWAGKTVEVQALLLNVILPAARAALVEQGIADDDLRTYFDDILRPRMLNGMNGARWQRSYVQYHGPNFQALTERYAALQATGTPGHCWEV